MISHSGAEPEPLKICPLGRCEVQVLWFTDSLTVRSHDERHVSVNLKPKVFQQQGLFNHELLSDTLERWTHDSHAPLVVFICVSAALSETAATFPAARGHREHLHQYSSESLFHHHHHQLTSVSGSSDQLNNPRPLSQDLAKTHRSLLHELQESILHLRAENLYQIFIDYKERYDTYRTQQNSFSV